MNRTTLFLSGALLVAVLPAAGHANGPNLAPNGDFDSGTFGWGANSAVQWSPTDAQGSEHSGSLLLVDSSGASGSVSTVSNCVPATPATTYLASVSTWVEGVSTDLARLSVQTYSDGACANQVTFVTSTGQAPLAAWAPFSVFFATGAAVHGVRLALVLSRGQGASVPARAWFDDVRFAASGCQPGPSVLCLNNGRFDVNVAWHTANGNNGFGQGVPFSADAGSFWFFSPENLELDVKVIDACTFNHRYWVYAAGLTDVGVTLQVLDTQTGQSKEYANEINHIFTTITDSSAFATCP